MSQFKRDVETTEQDESLSLVVVETVADAAGVDPLELPPLYGAVDPEALDSLFQPRPGVGDDRSAKAVRFTYHGYEVSVTEDGDVSLRER